MINNCNNDSYNNKADWRSLADLGPPIDYYPITFNTRLQKLESKITQIERRRNFTEDEKQEVAFYHCQRGLLFMHLGRIDAATFDFNKCITYLLELDVRPSFFLSLLSLSFF